MHSDLKHKMALLAQHWVSTRTGHNKKKIDEEYNDALVALVAKTTEQGVTPADKIAILKRRRDQLEAVAPVLRENHNTARDTARTAMNAYLAAIAELDRAWDALWKGCNGEAGTESGGSGAFWQSVATEITADATTTRLVRNDTRIQEITEMIAATEAEIAAEEAARKREEEAHRAAVEKITLDPGAAAKRIRELEQERAEKESKRRTDPSPQEPCVKCLTEARTRLFTPCGHIACCESCYKGKTCPICNADVEMAVRVYLS